MCISVNSENHAFPQYGKLACALTDKIARRSSVVELRSRRNPESIIKLCCSHSSSTPLLPEQPIYIVEPPAPSIDPQRPIPPLPPPPACRK